MGRPGSLAAWPNRPAGRGRCAASPPPRSHSASLHLLAVAFGPQADARTAIGSAVIDLTPGPVKEWAIQTFGMADKLVLAVLVLAVIAVVAAVTAMWETRRVPVGSIAIVAAGVAGCAAVLSRAGATLSDTVPALVGTACGVLVLRLLLSGRLTDQPGDDRRRRHRIPAADCRW